MRQTRQTVLWTALPAGQLASGGLRLSVLVSPRLFPDEGEPAVPLALFPDFVAWGEAPVQFAVRFGSGECRPATSISPPPRPELWRALLPPETRVRPFASHRFDHRRIHSYPVGTVRDYIQGQYEVLASAHPVDPPGLEAYSGMAHAIGGVRSMGEGAAEPRDALSHAFGLARSFVETLREKRPDSPAEPLDFHQRIAALGPYPEILRLLGLVYDLEIAAEGVMPEGRLRIEPRWVPQMEQTRNLTPFTQYLWDGRRFTAAPGPDEPEIDQGFLRLAAPAYGVAQVDLDAAVLWMTDFAHAVTQQRQQKAGPRESLVLPPLRSNGLAVYRSGRAASVKRLLGEVARKGEALWAGAEAVLYAADLVQGYRIDVWDARSGRWHSLCRRVGRYRFPGAQVVTREDEGILPLGAVVAPEGELGDLYVHELLFHWDGWSMVVPKPEESRPAAGGGDPLQSGRLEVSFGAAPRSLPRLRFGGVYRMRARSVDLAGNSVPLEEAEAEGFAHATEPVTYGRFEPVESPLVALTEKTGLGEAPELMVIRSDPDRIASEGKERLVAPPPVSLRTAEAHGKGTAGTVERSCLPDPIARGAAFRGLPGLPPGEVRRVDFGHLPWPNARPFRLRLEEGAGLPLWDEDRRLLTVYLEKGKIAKVKLSSYLHPEDLPELGIWQWLRQSGLPPAKLAHLKDLIAGGLHWMVTPCREITLVHAVRQPLAAPSWQAPTIARAPGQTFVTLVDRIAVHGRTTSWVAIEAAWQEPVSAPDGQGVQVAQRRSRIAEVPVGPDDESVPVKLRHEFGDHRYRKVEYTLVARSRFAAYFPDSPESGLTCTSARGIVQDVLSSARPPAPSVLWAEPLAVRAGWRVHLGQPWFVSGAGELLGVVVAEGRKAAAWRPPAGRDPAVTSFGLDLLWRSHPTFPQPAVSDFPGASVAAIGLGLPEATGAVVVAGHEVGFDPVRQSWRADLPITAGHGSIRFARLALVRYQPKSLPGMQLSPVALVSVARLPGGYTLTLVPGATPEEVTLVVVGSGDGGEQLADWVVTVERPGPEGWEPFGPSPAALAPSAEGPWPPNAWCGSVLVPAGERGWRLVLQGRGEPAGPALAGVQAKGAGVSQELRQTLVCAVIEG